MTYPNQFSRPAAREAAGLTRGRPAFENMPKSASMRRHPITRSARRSENSIIRDSLMTIAVIFVVVVVMVWFSSKADNAIDDFERTIRACEESGGDAVATGYALECRR